MSLADRMQYADFQSRIMTADEAARFVSNGDIVGMSGFTGAGYPKVLPTAIAARAREEHAAGRPFRIQVWTGASTAPEADGVMAEADAVSLRLPYNSDGATRKKINAGEIDYLDLHLSHVAQLASYGFLGQMNVAVIEIVGITADGLLIPSTAVGNNKTWLDEADKVILEINTRLPMSMEGMHDIYYGTALPPHRLPISLTRADNRIGIPYLRVDPKKVVAIVETNHPDRDNAFSQPDENSRRIAGHIIEFLQHEIRHGRLPARMLPIQSGVGNVANAVLDGLLHGPFQNLLGYTEVLQDGLLDLLRAGKMKCASATAVSFSRAAYEDFEKNIDFYRERIILRPQEISNHPELVRRLGVIAMNSMIEVDLYGHINSTHLMGSSMMNGIGGSGDFARNGYLTFFVTPSVAKDGKISCLVPMCSHVDHTEHDSQIIVTEQGLADLRGLSPRRRAQVLINQCAHPDYRPMLQDYFDRACKQGAQHTPHLLGEALSWHQRFLETGDMRQK